MRKDYERGGFSFKFLDFAPLLYFCYNIIISYEDIILHRYFFQCFPFCPQHLRLCRNLQFLQTHTRKKTQAISSSLIQYIFKVNKLLIRLGDLTRHMILCPFYLSTFNDVADVLYESIILGMEKVLRKNLIIIIQKAGAWFSARPPRSSFLCC